MLAGSFSVTMDGGVMKICSLGIKKGIVSNASGAVSLQD
jgi:hypothetical protein